MGIIIDGMEEEVLDYLLKALELDKKYVSGQISYEEYRKFMDEYIDFMENHKKNKKL